MDNFISHTICGWRSDWQSEQRNMRWQLPLQFYRDQNFSVDWSLIKKTCWIQTSVLKLCVSPSDRISRVAYGSDLPWPKTALSLFTRPLASKMWMLRTPAWKTKQIKFIKAELTPSLYYSILFIFEIHFFDGTILYHHKYFETEHNTETQCFTFK